MQTLFAKVSGMIRSGVKGKGKGKSKGKDKSGSKNE